MLWAVSRAPLAKLQAYKRRMGWTFPWASSFGGDFNPDFNVYFTEEQQREGGIEYNYQREPPLADALEGHDGRGSDKNAAMTGTDTATYTRERPGMSAFALEDGVVYHTYSAYARGLDALWGSTSGSTAPQRGATRPASGGAATTSTTRGERVAQAMRDSTAYRSAVGVALVAALMLVWLSLGVGIIGADGDPANLMYFGVLAVGIFGALVARFRPRGMARTLVTVAFAQALVAGIAIVAGLGRPWSGPLELLLLNGFFVSLFAGSAWLFRRAADAGGRP